MLSTVMAEHDTFDAAVVVGATVDTVDEVPVPTVVAVVDGVCEVDVLEVEVEVEVVVVAVVGVAVVLD